jgi:excisionase family DNA binding protein
MEEKKSAPRSTQSAMLWRVDEAAAYLHISVGTAYHWASQKRIPCLHLGARCLRFDPQEVKLWAAAFAGPTQSDHK